jgi:hypothetical protein
MFIFFLQINDLPMADGCHTLGWKPQGSLRGPKGLLQPMAPPAFPGRLRGLLEEPPKMIEADAVTGANTDEAPPRESRRAMQRRMKRPPGRPRNPHLEQRFAPTQEQRDLVRLLAGYGIPPDRICKVIKNPHTKRPIGRETLEKRFEDELECGSAEMDAVCCDMLSRKIRQGNIVAIIWYMKNQHGLARRNRAARPQRGRSINSDQA